jgi:putative salt-induced outer membrane protein YdiY
MSVHRHNLATNVGPGVKFAVPVFLSKRLTQIPLLYVRYDALFFIFFCLYISQIIVYKLLIILICPFSTQ